MSAWPEEVGRALLAAGVPWLPGMLSHGGMRVAVFMEANTMPHSADWLDLRDDATRGAVRGWLSDRVGGPISMCFDPDKGAWIVEAESPETPCSPECERFGVPRMATCHTWPTGKAVAADWREAEARALLALAREVLA